MLALRRLGFAVAILGAAQSAHGQYLWQDPYKNDSKVAPAPGSFWTPTVELPAITRPPSAAPAPSAAGALTLPELTEYALRNNPRTREAWLAARAAAAGVSIERADLLPQISGLYNVTRLQQASATTGTVVPWQTRWGPSISFSYLLFDFGARSAQVDAAQYRLLAANLSQNRVLQDVVFQVEQAYYRLIGTDALVKVNEQTLQNLKTAYDAAQRRRESGLATAADVYRAETQVAQAQVNLTRTRGELEKARGLLANAAGLPVNGSLRIAPITGAPHTDEITSSVADLLERAKQTRPDLVAAEAQARASRATAQAVSKATLPSIEVTGSAGRVIFPDNRPVVPTYNIGLNLRIPLFTGFRDTYSVRQAEAQAAQAEAARDRLYHQTELDVWQAYYDLQTAASEIASTATQVKSAEQTSHATLARYQAGFGTLLDLITAQLDESNAKVQQVQSYLDWYTAVSRLNFSVGLNDLMMAGDKK
ncbi:MAG: TolC family protein [Rhodospirillaceae bacterium]